MSWDEFNSLWLEAREDIYHFFCEAIHNVIYHAQPPHGKATQVKISLHQQDTRCTLTIENDGAQVDASVFERLATPRRRRSGYAHASRLATPAQSASQMLRTNSGYGTKLMKIIASELPNGTFEPVALPEGGMRIQLAWNQSFNL